MGLVKNIESLAATIVASIILIVLSVIYFGLTLWIIKAATTTFFGAGLEANWAVLSAALMAVGAVVAGALDKSG